MNSPKLAVILPTYNEAENIPVIVEKIASALRGIEFEIIVVDDNSPDRTAQVARDLSGSKPYVRCIRRVGRRGLSGACLEGMMATSAPVMVVMDADMQHDETILPMMLAEIDAGADLVVGTRYAPSGVGVQGFSSTRAKGSEFATGLARLVIGDMVSDPMSGFFMLTRQVADRAAVQVSGEGFKILFDLVSRIGSSLSIKEVPFVFKERKIGDSKLGLLVTIQFLGLLVSRFTGGVLPVQFLLFALVGLSGLAVHMGVLYALTGVGVHFATSQICATLVAMTTNFIINNSVTYAHKKLRGKRFFVGLATFAAVCSFGAIANISISTQVFQWNSSVGVAGLAGALMSSVFNYSVTKLVTWRD